VNKGEKFAGKGNTAVVRETETWPLFFVLLCYVRKKDDGG